MLVPPAKGSVLNVFTFPPDAAWKGKVGAAEVAAYFKSVGAPGASTYSPQAPHPYMQKTRTLDFCIVLEGEIVLVLDTQEVTVKAGEFVVKRGTNHAWSNRSGKPAVVAIASHGEKIPPPRGGIRRGRVGVGFFPPFPPKARKPLGGFFMRGPRLPRTGHR